VMRKPDAGNLHVRFDEGEGTRRSLALPLIPCVPLYSTKSVLLLFGEGAETWHRHLGDELCGSSAGRRCHGSAAACAPQTRINRFSTEDNSESVRERAKGTKFLSESDNLLFFPSPLPARKAS